MSTDMMDDILRSTADMVDMVAGAHPMRGATLRKAADTISSLRQEVETLWEALKPFADAVYNDNGDVTVSYHGIDIGHWLRAYRLQRARPKDKP